MRASLVGTVLSMAPRFQPSVNQTDHPAAVYGLDVTEERLVTAVLRVGRPRRYPARQVGERSYPGLREPDRRRLLIGGGRSAGHRAVAVPLEPSLLSLRPPPLAPAAERSQVPGEFFALGRSLAVPQMPKPALADRVVDQGLAGFVEDLAEAVGQR